MASHRRTVFQPSCCYFSWPFCTRWLFIYFYITLLFYLSLYHGYFRPKTKTLFNLHLFIVIIHTASGDSIIIGSILDDGYIFSVLTQQYAGGQSGSFTSGRDRASNSLHSFKDSFTRHQRDVLYIQRLYVFFFKLFFSVTCYSFYSVIFYFKIFIIITITLHNFFLINFILV